jgi:hypothetical protein
VDTGLQSHWKLDETSGTTAVDSISGFNGTLTNFQVNPWSASPNSKIDGALEFNNANSTRVVISDVYDFAGNATFSVAAWIYRLNTTGNAFPTIISKVDDPGTGNQGWSIAGCNSCGTANRRELCRSHARAI